MTGFENGYKAFANMGGVNQAVFVGDGYVGNVENAIDELQKSINELSKDGRHIAQLKGIVAEFWHAGTHNIIAEREDVSAKVEVLESKVVGSVDIKGNWDNSDFGLKFLKDGKAAGKAHAEIYRAKYEKFCKSQIKKGHQPISYEEYFQKEYEKYLTECVKQKRTPQNIDEVFPGYKDHNNPLYMGQYRIIAKDQIEEAKAWLKRKIHEETNSARSSEQVKRYQETLNKLTDRIKSNEGSESIPISKEEAEELARLAKEGGFDPADWGLTTENLIKWENIMKQANKAALTAALISIVLEVAPELLKTIEKAFSDEGANADDFKRVGFAALKGSTLGYIRGSIAAATTIACKSGKLGTTLKDANPSVIGVIVVLTMNTIQNATLMALGHTTKQEFAIECIQDLFTTSCAVALGVALQSLLSLGYMLGSFIGGIVGSFAYQKVHNCTMSYCINTGCTFFGLVKQDYTLPKEVIEDMGLEVFKYEKFEYKFFEYKTFEYKTFQYKKFEYTPINIRFIRRGVIGVNTVGFVT